MNGSQGLFVESKKTRKDRLPHLLVVFFLLTVF